MFAAAFDPRSAPVATIGSVGLWAAWAIGLCATLVRHPISLTVVRAAAPGAVVAVSAAALIASDRETAWIAIGATVAVAVSLLAFAPEVAISYVNGPAYPNERRYPLRVPGPLLFGPLAISWALSVVVPAAGVLLLAARSWLLGGACVLAGLVAAFFLGRSLHSLSRRWVVFVPAGLVLHDPIVLADPVLFRKQDVVAVRAAPADSDATDLTSRAFGLALEIELVEPAPVALVKAGSRVPATATVSKVLFTPTRPGAVLSEARERRLG